MKHFEQKVSYSFNFNLLKGIVNVQEDNGTKEGKKCPKHKKHLRSPFLKTTKMGKSMGNMWNQRVFSVDKEGSGQGEFSRWCWGNELREMKLMV